MIYFDSDYMTGAHPLVLKRLNETNSLHTVGYGRDEFTAGARRMILDACGIDDGEVYFLEGGTQTNAVVIDRLLDHNDGVIATDTAHINVHEAGAIEATGHKVLALPNHDGKLRACDIRDYIADFYRDDTHHYMVRPAMKPKFSRINPLEGFKRLFSLKSLVETLKNLIKIAILMVIIFLSIRDMFLESSRYLYTDLTAAVAHLVEMAGGMVMRICIAFVAVAAMDFFYQWWDYERQMKMTKQEVKEEYKQMEGDPQVKGKIKEIQRRRAQQRMMQQVPGADVVIRNPTHFAVALRYRPDEDDAPIVLAKGQDNVAMRIVEIAEENKIAVVENVPLARALYAQTELNQMIPPDLYGPVAEVLVYIFKLNDKKQIVK